MNYKSFRNWTQNKIQLTFPNGNRLSTIWGHCSYSDNYDEGWFDKFMDSDTCEVMVLKAPDRLVKKIHKKYDKESDGGSVIGYLTMDKWLDIVRMLSK